MRKTGHALAGLKRRGHGKDLKAAFGTTKQHPTGNRQGKRNFNYMGHKELDSEDNLRA